MRNWLSSLPVLAMAGLVLLVSLQSACSGDADDRCKHSRGGCHVDPDDPDETFLEKINPLD
jgi:hypothetical protein